MERDRQKTVSFKLITQQGYPIEAFDCSLSKPSGGGRCLAECLAAHYHCYDPKGRGLF